jgi:hypothetical protein
MRAVGVMRVVKEHNATTRKWNQMAAVCLFEHRLIKHELCWAVRDNAPGKCDDVVESLRGAGEIVRCRHDRAPTRSLSIKDVHDLLLRRGVNASDRFVKQIDLRVCGNSARQEDPTALSAREFANLSLRKVRHIHTRERINNRGVIGNSRSTKGPERRRAAHHHHLADRDGETPVNLLGLRHICHTLRVHANTCSKHMDAATPRLHQAGNALQQCRLSSAVWSKDGGE